MPRSTEDEKLKPAEQIERGFNFLTFTPRNEKARPAFDNLAQNKPYLHEHHSRS